MYKVNLDGLVPSAGSIAKPEIKLSFALHSIVLLIGPDGSGKTQFAFEQLIPQLKSAQIGKKNIKIGYISLDSIFAELLDNFYFSKNSNEYKSVEQQAYNIFFSKLLNYITYPVSFDFVIVDAQSLEQDFRTEILKTGEDNHYNVSALVFDYENKEDYFIVDQNTGERSRPAGFQMKAMKRLLSGELMPKKYSSVEYVKTRDFNKYEVCVNNYIDYDQYILPEDREYVIIGDIHGCYDELISLLKANGFIIGEDLKVIHPENKSVILVGDLVDKGYAIDKVIELAYANIGNFFMVIGNHESLVHKKLTGTLAKGGLPSSDVVEEYFNTIEMLQEPKVPVQPQEPKESVDEEYLKKYKSKLVEYEKQLDIYNSIPKDVFETKRILREKFIKVVESMKNFYVHKNFIVTHAPCEKKYLGKITSEALKMCRNFRYPKRKDYETFAEFIYEFDKHTSFVREDSNSHHPIHVFGHVMSKEVSRHNNKISIDTGCVSGGTLSSIIICDDGISSITIPATNSVKSKEQLQNFFS